MTSIVSPGLFKVHCQKQNHAVKIVKLSLVNKTIGLFWPKLNRFDTHYMGANGIKSGTLDKWKI